MRARHTSVLLLLAVTLTGLLAFASAALARPTTCGFIRASVPYTHHGRHDRWRVYKTGKTSCAAANRALYAVVHLNARMHVGSSNATSYFTYHGWRCDFGQMGEEWCGMPGHRPYRAQALALECATAGCPARVPCARALLLLRRLGPGPSCHERMG